jgi:hypothetical protein
LVINASVGYGTAPRLAELRDAINLLLKTILPTLIGDNRWGYFLGMAIPPSFAAIAIHYSLFRF